MRDVSGIRVFLLCLMATSWIVAASRSPQEHAHRHHLGSHRHRERRKEGQVLHRSKRGWVWNQFFVIEEYTGPDPVLVGRVRNNKTPLSMGIKGDIILLLLITGTPDNVGYPLLDHMFTN